jgi:hypothetical protein
MPRLGTFCTSSSRLAELRLRQNAMWKRRSSWPVCPSKWRPIRDTSPSTMEQGSSRLVFCRHHDMYRRAPGWQEHMLMNKLPWLSYWFQDALPTSQLSSGSSVHVCRTQTVRKYMDIKRL